jgi:hypothetical protein
VHSEFGTSVHSPCSQCFSFNVLRSAWRVSTLSQT